MKKWIILLVILCIGFLAAFIASNVYWNAARDGWHEEEERILSQAENCQSAFEETEGKLTDARQEFADFQENKEVKLQDLNLKLEEVEGQLAKAKDRIKSEHDLAKFNLRLKDSYYKKKLEEKFQEGKESVLPKKPTYAQVMEMTRTVRVAALLPDACTGVAMQCREMWREKGWKVGIASVYFKGLGGHIIIVFDTSDREEVFMDIYESTFKEVTVEENESYTRQNDLPYPGFDDTITAMFIMW